MVYHQEAMICCCQTQGLELPFSAQTFSQILEEIGEEKVHNQEETCSNQYVF